MTLSRASSKIETRLPAVLFCMVLVFHAWGATVGWKSLNLPGCEFRQAQTAVSAYFIQKENNFSLAYPTPVLGKPWSIPMEFPLYQWTVVKFSNVTGVPLTESGRTVSLLCFYLTLPALYLLIRRLGFSSEMSLVALGLVVCCPLYVFYARSFLIETMAWMFGSWFLLGYVEVARRHSKAWWAIAAFCGAGAGLVKVTTLMVFLMPAFIWTMAYLWQDLRSEPAKDRVRAVLRRGIWCLSSVALPCAAAIWWVNFSDQIKAQSITGSFLQSERMSPYNFGVGVRFDPGIWTQHWIILFREIASVPVLVMTGLIGSFFARRRLWLVLLLVGFFFLVQLIFPILYAWHEYYYVAIAMMLMIAMGFTLCGLLESNLPRWVVWMVVAGIYGAQAWTYVSYHYPIQKEYSPGGSDLTLAIRRVTNPDDVLIIAGDDWNSMLPYYAQRRSYMIRRNLERTWDEINPALDKLGSEPVMALILFREQRQNNALISQIVTKFSLYPKPVFTWQDADVYLHTDIRIEGMPTLSHLGGIRVAPDALAAWEDYRRKEIEVASLLPRYRERFRLFSPAPWKFYTTFGADVAERDGNYYYSADPDSKLWFKAKAGSHSMEIEVMIWPDAYTDKIPYWERSDGIEVRVLATQSNGISTKLFSRRINPRDNKADRPAQALHFDFTLTADADIELEILPGPDGNAARDWTAVRKIRLN